MDRKVTVAALAAAGLALILSCVALVATLQGDRDSPGDRTAAPADDGGPGALDGLARDVASLKGDVARLSSGLEKLAAREPPPAASAAPAAPAKIDLDEVARLVDERMREAIATATGRARMRPEELPQPVRDAAAKTLAGAKITRAELRHDKGRSYYRLKARLDGEDYDLRIAPGGEVIEAEMPVDLAPRVVRDAAAKAVEGIVLNQVKLEPGGGGRLYDVEGRAGGRKYDLQILPDGQVIEIDGPGRKVRFEPKAPGAGGGGGVF